MMNATLNRQQLMACLLVDIRLWNEYNPWRGQLVLNGEESGFRAWVGAIGLHFDQWGTLPDIMTMQTLVPQLVGGWSPEELMVVSRDCQAASMLVGSITTESREQVLRIGTELLVAYTRALAATRAANLMAQNPDSAPTIMQDLQTQLVTADAMGGRRYKPLFPNLDFPVLPADTYQPIGLGFIDNMLGGGLMSGEVVGHSAPINQGKTTLVLQVMYSRAWAIYSRKWAEAQKARITLDLSKCPLIYVFCYENIKNLRATLVSGCARIPRDTAQNAMLFGVEKANLSTSAERNYKDYERSMFASQLADADAGKALYPHGELERFKELAWMTDQLICVVDFSGADEDYRKWSTMGEAGMVEFIRTDQVAMGNPGVNFVALDYVGAMVRVGEGAGRLRKSENTFNITAAPFNLARDVAAPFDCPVWACHQLNSGENKKAGGTVPDVTASSGSGMFLEGCAAGIASGMLTAQNVAVYKVGKSRRMQSAGAEFHLATLEKRFARWARADNVIVVDGVVMPKNEVSSARLPPGARAKPTAAFGDIYAE